MEDENLLGEILLRVAPLPSSLLRASLVSKQWERLAAAPAFHRRFVAHHRQPPILGVFGQQGRELVFTSLLDAPDRIPRERFSLRPGGHGDEIDFWALLGCRHGRVLFVSTFRRALLVFDPVSGDRRRVAIPLDFAWYVLGGAVLCAAGDDQDHVHGDCHSSPFKVVLVGTRLNHPAIAQVYSSETGMWGDLVSTTKPCDGLTDSFPCTLVGNVLYWWLYGHNNGILEFDMHSQTLAVTEGPSHADIDSINSRIIRGEDGGVGIAVFSYLSLKMWKRKVSSQGIHTWVLPKIVIVHKIIDLTHPIKAMDAIVGYSEVAGVDFISLPCCSGRIRTGKEAIVGYSEDAHALFIKVSCCSGPHTFIVELESMQSRKINQSFLENSYHPFTDFFTAGTVRA
ncbi:hypothetical protein CFC21_090975 [Triticum aestivum]|uniref:F-box protein AT5G49610-like beta-propeller domain-containing protein n=2 Tax=Triticum aestivum TaxID=4565 RepID=A0A9R1LF92_WHEAT|nr:uncharacterized protein LOC123143078 isoform X1 [Triticum aestivum]XP_044417798.1 uncharacterized protein LOC123143078 isoform X1 [Triticum aestivum]XP_044417799.1 uncharacterized protein LOC123143078 isoform X1 [Triticum aestivum]KAF7087816.1 hypothetical protein CFC21_090975 [Triticum aestivum]